MPTEITAALGWLAPAEAGGVTGTNRLVDGRLTADLAIVESLPTA